MDIRRSVPRLVTIHKANSNLNSFEDIVFSENTFSIDVSYNNIQDFTGLPQLHVLRELILDSNPISNFTGASYQPNLKFISIKKSKILSNPNFKLMCLIVFGSQLTTVNGQRVTHHLRSIADSLRPSTISELKKGSVITQTKPLKLFNEIRSKQNEQLVQETNSLAFICHNILDDKYNLKKDDIIKFQKKLKYLKHKYNNPFEPIYDKNMEFSSDASFENTTVLRKVKYPRLDDYYYSSSYSDSFE
ncbi:hypothetical protein M9Y10_041099 [Tritrichomonas musculus]|uniref:Leucine Rich Repeat family protein n=1 Tax=Tritrichomonas musculus TaxID=1915356 RepID=A0ABR2K583_9EUKA